MKNNNHLKIYILSLIMTLSISFGSFAQEEIEFDGTYTIYVKSLKESKEALTEEQLLEIQSLRKDSEDFLVNIDNLKVLIMSREKMEADFKWVKYSLNKL